MYLVFESDWIVLSYLYVPVHVIKVEIEIGIHNTLAVLHLGSQLEIFLTDVINVQSIHLLQLVLHHEELDEGKELGNLPVEGDCGRCGQGSATHQEGHGIVYVFRLYFAVWVMIVGQRELVLHRGIYV